MKIIPLKIAPVFLLILVHQFMAAQEYNPFGEYGVRSESNSTVNMHLLPEDEFEVGEDQWGDIVRVNMLKIKDWSRVPGVKKAWIMKGFEGVEGMAFHPVISEVKDVDGDGKADIFRCRSEHEGARIERLRYDDGSVVWESEAMAALHGDESRLPVFDLDGDGEYSVLHATKGGTWCINAETGKTEWAVEEAKGDIIVGHFLDKKKQAVMVRSDGTLRCYNEMGSLVWKHETGLTGGDAYAHEAYRHDVDGDGLDEIFANWQKLTMALKGDGTVLWKDVTQRHHSDFLVCADVDADGKVELIYDHEGCDSEKGPVYIVDPMTGTVENIIDYRGDGLSHAQNVAVGDFDPERKGQEIAICGKLGNLYVWGGDGELLWNRNVPSSLLSKGDWDGDGVEDISCHALGANVDGMFSVWTGRGERLYALSFLPSPSRRTWSEEHNGGSWSHATPGGHEGIRRQVDLDRNGYADFILGMGAWHWGSDAILFLMEGSNCLPSVNQYSSSLDIESVRKVVNDAAVWQADHMPDRGRNPAYNPKYTGWADGVFLSALADWAEFDNSRDLRAWYERIADEQKWEVGHRSLNPANDISVALMYAKIWQKEKTPRYILSEIEQWDRETITALAGGWKELIPTIERLDYQMKYYPKTDNINFEIAQNQERWCWCDALYMAAPTYALYANITGNDEYREFMNREFWVTLETLYDRKERLVFRDTRFFNEKEPNGEKVFWGRGNGWVLGAFARVMSFLPRDYHSRDKYEKYFVRIMSRIVELQGADGYWRSSLLDPGSYPSQETSATGFYTYALWWGINNGLLDSDTYLEPASRAWEAMVKAVQPSGMLGYVQAIGDTPQNVSANSNEVYGTAAFMLAGLEVSKYLQASASLKGTVYYVDSHDGSDTNTGSSAARALKSLEPVNALNLLPGDKVLLKAGSEFSGPLSPKGSGIHGHPIIIDRYGEGANPLIAGEGMVENTLSLHNQHHWEIRNLTITNTDGGSWDDEGRVIRRAVYVSAVDAGDIEHIHLKNLEIRDVRGMYRFEGSGTNGGIVCQVKGGYTKTRFTDLRIEDCVFHTNSIDRYPLVVTSTWGMRHPGKIVYANNTLDHTGRSHMVFPADQWPGKLVYYFDPEVQKVFSVEKASPPVSPFTGRAGCEDIFSEIDARLKRSWGYFEETRLKPGHWLFANEPGGKVHHVDEGAYFSPSYPLAYYGELRAFGFIPPWLDMGLSDIREQEESILNKWIKELETVGVKREEDWSIRNRVFMNNENWPKPRTGKAFLQSLSPGGVKPDLSSKEKTLKYFNSLPWANDPYSACGRIGHALDLYILTRVQEGNEPFDEIYDYVKELVDGQYNYGEGYWGGQNSNFVNRTSGNMKILTIYARFDWKIPEPKKIIDYHLSGATEEAGFEGGGCAAFNQMHPLVEIFLQYPELQVYRSEEIDKYTAMTFMTFLENWDEKTNFYGKTWLGKHNNGVPTFMVPLILDLPFVKVSTIYNWREGPIITRGKDGKIKVNKVIYQRKGFRFFG